MEIAFVIVAKVGFFESAVTRLGLVGDRDMRLHTALVHQPVQHFGRTIGAVGGEPRAYEPQRLDAL